jgi:hypothetical protein
VCGCISSFIVTDAKHKQGVNCCCLLSAVTFDHIRNRQLRALDCNKNSVAHATTGRTIQYYSIVYVYVPAAGMHKT